MRRRKAVWLACVFAGTLLAQTSALPDEERDVSWKKLIPNILADQKYIWTFPARLAQGHDLLPTAGILGIGTVLVVADPHISGYFHDNTPSFRHFDHVFGSNITTAAIIAVPAALLVTGMLRKDTKMRNTALLAAEAVADTEVVQVVFKGATGRLRPGDLPPNANFADSWNDRSGFTRFQSSFPSGHALSAFAVATVIAHQYREHRWVPYAAYGVAAAIGFSRVSLGAHYSSDVFFGAALGYMVAHFAVLRHPHLTALPHGDD